jgi:hypothetical protein
MSQFKHRANAWLRKIVCMIWLDKALKNACMHFKTLKVLNLLSISSPSSSSWLEIFLRTGILKFFLLLKILQTHTPISKATRFFTLYLRKIFQPWTGSSSAALLLLNCHDKTAQSMPWLRGAVEISSASGTRRPGFESRQDVRLLGKT